MSQSNAAAASAPTGGSAALLDDLLPSTVSAVEAADALFAKAKAAAERRNTRTEHQENPAR